MIAGKTHAQQKPTALGSMVNASTFGLAIPDIIGTTRVNLLAIWAQNLRHGKCRGKKYKGKKKGVPNYVENIDFLIGANPIEGALQAYLNGGKYSLNFLEANFTTAARSITISDANFYFLLAVTAEIENTGFFNDYGSPNYGGIGSAAVTFLHGGSGYAVNDVFAVQGTNGAQAIGTVTAVSGGAVTAFTLSSIGSGYQTGTFGTTNISGTGTGLLVDINANGVPYSNTSEYPLWNIAQHGPDLIDAGYAKFYPFIYKWLPSDGATFYLPSIGFGGGGLAGGNNNFHAYYAQLSSEAENLPPITAACLTWEPALGDGPEYGSAFASQQIVYDEYAGAGSSDIDLGASGMIPQIQLEVKGKFARWQPRGDADFADAIEHVVKSGLMQTGASLGLIQAGANCNDLPGAVQKMQFYQLEPSCDSGAYLQGFQQPIKAGTLIFAFMSWRPQGAGTVPSISDDAGNTWIPIFTIVNCGFWYAIAAADHPAGDNVHALYEGPGFCYDLQARGWAMDPGFSVLDGTPVTSSGTAAGTISITTSGPAYILAAMTWGSGGSDPNWAPHWSKLFPTLPPSNGGWSDVWYRYVAAAGTYSLSVPASAGWTAAMIALKTSQPSGSVPYPKALGNIIDITTMDVVRAQDQAAGLIGSVNMNAQRKCSDWLADFYKCANADPVWSGFVLKSIDKSEVSAVGNGRVYVATTAAGPVATLKESDLVADPTSPGPLITVSRQAQTNTDNVIQAQFFDRNSDYNPSTASEPLGGAVSLFGPRKQSPQDLPMIQDPAVARMILAIQARRYSLLRNTYKFVAKPNWMMLEAGDLVAVTDSRLNIVNLPVRLTSVAENEMGALECEAEPFVYGSNAPNPGLAVTASGLGYSPGDGGDPGSVNAPIIFEAVPRLSGQGNQEELWAVVSASSPNYGGCAVLISTDGGASYRQVGQINNSAVTGVTVGDWPAANDPDTTNNLSVDLTESLGVLETFAAADRDAFTDPCYVAGGTTCVPYELMCYDIATLTTAYKYTLPATGGGTNELRRGVFGAPGPTVGVGVDHPGGSRIAYLDPSGDGTFKIALDPAWIGKTIYFKFLAINTLGNNLQDQSAATAYSFTPSGCAAQQQNPNVNSYSVNAVLTQPTATTIHMAGSGGSSSPVIVTFPSNQASYAARDLTIAAPAAPTPYYVTIYDPAQLGDVESPAPTAYADTTTTRWNSPGYIRVGTIVAIPGGGGTVTGGGGSGATPASNPPVKVGFPCATGATGTDVAADLAAYNPGQITKWKIVVKASDPATDLTIVVKQNSTTILTQTVAHATAAHTVATGNFSSPLVVAENDVFSLNITSGTATWMFTVQLT